MKYALILVLISTTACSSLSQKVFSDIHKGDPDSKVARILGKPASFQPNKAAPSFDNWKYVENKDICIILLKNGTVVNAMCGAKD